MPAAATPFTSGDVDKGKLIKAEEREVGSVSAAVYKAWIDGAGGWGFLIVATCLYLSGEAARVASSFWLGIWAGDDFTKSAGFYMGIYFVLSLVQTMMTAFVSVVGAIGSINASRSLHRSLVETVLYAPMSFFDATPLGRIVNRFTKDMSQMDSTLMFNLQSEYSCRHSAS